VDDSAATAPDFTDLQTAIDTVASGDVLLVRSGNYPMMRIRGKSLTLQAEDGATVNIVNGANPWPPPLCDVSGVLICNLGPSQSVRLRGLTIQAKSQGLLLSSNAGLVWIEDCSILCVDHALGILNGCAGSGAGLLARDCQDIVLVRTDFTGTDGEGCNLWGGCEDCNDSNLTGGAGLELDSSNLHAFGCSFQGGMGRGRYGSRCEFERQKGGYGVRGYGNPAPFLFLSDCTLRGGVGFGCVEGESCFCEHNIGGDGLFWEGPAAVLDSTIEEGATTGVACAPECPPIEVGVPVTPDADLVLDPLPGQALRMRIASPVREGGTIDIAFEGPLDARVWLVASTSAEALYLDVPGHPRGTLLVGAPRWFVFAGRTDASGILTRSYTLGPLPPGLDAQIFFGQALALIPSLGPGRGQHARGARRVALIDRRRGHPTTGARRSREPRPRPG
jgi:hypothetical protein